MKIFVILNSTVGRISRVMLVFEHIGKNNKNKRLIDTITSNNGLRVTDSLSYPTSRDAIASKNL